MIKAKKINKKIKKKNRKETIGSCGQNLAQLNFQNTLLTGTFSNIFLH